MIDFSKCLAVAKEQGIEEFELYISRNASPIKFETFRGELTSFTSSDVTTISARGIVDGKMGYAFSEVLDDSTAEFLAKQVKANAGIVNGEEKPFIFGGSKSYEKVNTYNENLEKVSVEDKIALLYKLEADVKSSDSRITEVETYYGETIEEVIIVNSNGLNLNNKINYFVMYVSVVAKDGDEVKSGFKFEFGNDYSKIDSEKFVKDCVEKTVSQFGGDSCLSQQCPCVFDQQVTANLLAMYLESVKAENVQKHSSVFEGKLNTAVANEKVTVIENPLLDNCLCRTFDDEGVATFKKTFVEKGILKSFAYNLTTADKDKVMSTGNGYKQGAVGRVTTQFCNVVLESGDLTQDQLFNRAENGVYITSVAGLHSGMNPISGNFSLQASGYMIENGKKGRPVTLITIAGNLFEMFNDVIEVGNDSMFGPSGYTCPSILIKNIAVSGK